ncbi:MAG: outer membrane protein assembly factor BamE [Spongiibacteraceae bacterium]
MYRSLTIACLIFTLSACGSIEFPGVYRLPIAQGNIIDAKMIKQLEVGMSESQVEYILGRALIRDTFSPNRWDYAYMLRDPENDKIIRHTLNIFFEDGALKSYTTDVDLSEKETEPEPAPEAKE